MHSLWSWISSLCRQKRILVLLCTFGSSFLAFNYSLLSSSTTIPSPNSFSTSKVDDVDNFGGDLSRRKYEELDNNIQQQQQQGGHYLKPLIKVPVSALSSLSSSHNVTKASSISLSSTNKEEEKTPITQLNKASIYHVSQSHLPPPVSKHAQKSFLLQQRKVANNQLVVMIDEHSRQQANNNRKNNINIKEKNRVNFLQSVIEEKDYNSNNNISMSSNLQRANDSISIGFHFSSKPFTSSSNALSNAIDNNDNVKSDEKIRQSTVASFSSSTSPSEIIDASISISSSSSRKKTISSDSGAITTDFPILSNSIQSSLIQPSRPGLFSPALTAAPRPSLEFSSFQPQQQQQPTSFYAPSSSSSATISSNNNSNHPFSSPVPISSVSKSNLLSPFDIPPCNTTFQLRRIQKRKKNLTVIENFIMGWRHVKCNETITYTTHGDYRYLDNLVPLVDRWNGPISLAIYCPGDDLDVSLKLISYLKLCTSPNIDKWVTFHLIYDSKFVKRPVTTEKHGDIPWLDTLYERGKWKDCLQKPTFSKGNYTFRIQNGLLYPINIARNIARAAATTYFVLASDIELYPSINLIPGFMEMLGRLQKKKEAEENNYAKKNNKFTAAAAAVMAKIFFSGSESETSSSSTSGSSTASNGNNNGFAGEELAEQRQTSFTSTKLQQNELQQQQQQQHHRLSDLQQRSRHVFVLPVFEVKKDIVPCQVETKEQLASLLKHHAAVLFHHSICPQCHTFPKYDEWKMSYPTNGTEGTLKDYRKHNCTSVNGVTLPPPSSTVYMRIFQTGKRKHPFQLWEPIFIGTKEEPIYDERLSWEGLRDKMVSGYIMCALDYNFYILDNAFLVHKPGIRKVNHLVTKTVMSQDRLINYRIRSELLKKFGKHDECAL